MKEHLKTIGLLFLIVLLIAAGIWYDIFRWHVFQDATGSDVSYWKWRFLIDVQRGR